SRPPPRGEASGRRRPGRHTGRRVRRPRGPRTEGPWIAGFASDLLFLDVFGPLSKGGATVSGGAGGRLAGTPARLGAHVTRDRRATRRGSRPSPRRSRRRRGSAPPARRSPPRRLGAGCRPGV